MSESRPTRPSASRGGARGYPHREASLARLAALSLSRGVSGRVMSDRTPISGAEAHLAMGGDPAFTPKRGNKPASSRQLFSLNLRGRLALLPADADEPDRSGPDAGQ